ncbi:hypothetical protein Bbelb_318220 [Branchiostoma belcheri]|nr:hypothetical protein Bbelb_318220 [Branchiostoma belcheri]
MRQHIRFPAEVVVRDDVEMSRKVTNTSWSEITWSLGLGDPVILTEVYLSASGFYTEGQAFQVKKCTGHLITIEPIVKVDNDFVTKPDVVSNLKSLLEVVTIRKELLQDELYLESAECHEHSYGAAVQNIKTRCAMYTVFLMVTTDNPRQLDVIVRIMVIILLSECWSGDVESAWSEETMGVPRIGEPSSKFAAPISTEYIEEKVKSAQKTQQSTSWNILRKRGDHNRFLDQREHKGHVLPSLIDFNFDEIAVVWAINQRTQELTAAMKDTGVPFRLMEKTDRMLTRLIAKQLERVFEKLDLKAVLTNRWSPAGPTVVSLTFSVFLDIIAVEVPVGIVAGDLMNSVTGRFRSQPRPGYPLGPLAHALDKNGNLLSLVVLSDVSPASTQRGRQPRLPTPYMGSPLNIFVPGPCTPEAPQATNSVKFVPGPRTPNREPDIESAPMLNFNRDIKSTKQALEGAERASGGATYYIKGPRKTPVKKRIIVYTLCAASQSLVKASWIPRRGASFQGSCPNISLEGCEHLHELNERCKFTLLVVPRASIKYYKSLYNSDYLQDDSMTRQAIESKPSIRIMELEGQAKVKMNGIAAAEFLDKLSVENPDKYETMLSTIRRKRREFHILKYRHMAIKERKREDEKTNPSKTTCPSSIPMIKPPYPVSIFRRRRLLGLRTNVVAEPDNPLDKDAMVVVMPPLNNIPSANAKRSTAARHIAGKWIGRLLAGLSTILSRMKANNQNEWTRRVEKNVSKIWVPNNDSRVCSIRFVDSEPAEANPWPTQHMNTPGLQHARKKPAPRTPVESSLKKGAWKEKYGNFVKARTFIRDHIGKDSHSELAHPDGRVTCYIRMACYQDAFRGTFDNAKRAGRPGVYEETEAVNHLAPTPTGAAVQGQVTRDLSPGEVTLKPYRSCKNLCTTHLPSEEQEQWLQSLSEGMSIAEFKKGLEERLCREVWKKTSTNREVVGRRADKHFLSLTGRNILQHLSCVEDIRVTGDSSKVYVIIQGQPIAECPRVLEARGVHRAPCAPTEPVAQSPKSGFLRVFPSQWTDISRDYVYARAAISDSRNHEPSSGKDRVYAFDFSLLRVLILIANHVQDQPSGQANQAVPHRERRREHTQVRPPDHAGSHLHLPGLEEDFEVLAVAMKDKPGDDGHLRHASFKQQALKWGKFFRQHVTPYIHIMVYHRPHFLEKYRYLNDLSCESVEQMQEEDVQVYVAIHGKPLTRTTSLVEGFVSLMGALYLFQLTYLSYIASAMGCKHIQRKDLSTGFLKAYKKYESFLSDGDDSDEDTRLPATHMMEEEGNFKHHLKPPRQPSSHYHEMGLKSEGVQHVARNCADHYKSMEMIQIAIKGSTDEMLVSYVREKDLADNSAVVTTIIVGLCLYSLTSVAIKIAEHTGKMWTQGCAASRDQINTAILNLGVLMAFQKFLEDVA